MIRRSKPLRRQLPIRQLRRGDPLPAGEPKRYDDPRGYVRLRWRVGDEYVETYERDDAGDLVRTKPPSQKRIDVAEAWRLYEAGMTLPAVAERVGCDHGALSRALRRAGYTMRPPNSYRHTEPDGDEIVRLYTSGLGLRDTARSLGTSVGKVSAVLRERRVVVRYRRMADRTRSAYEAEFSRQRPLVRRRSGGVCEARVDDACSGRATHVHHRRLRSQGGTNALVNLLDVCVFCHGAIHGNPARSFAAGLLVSAAADPAAVPVTLARWAVRDTGQ